MTKKTQLNAQQKEAVLSTDGRILILAGAGSGKTKVIIERISHLIQNNKAKPQEILGLTFTNKAADEMKERLSTFIGKKEAKEVILSTFHSFCVRILREEIGHLGFTEKFSLYDEQDFLRMAKTLARELSGTKAIPSLKGCIEEINVQKNQAEIDLSLSPFAQKLAEKIKRSMRAHNAVDLDSLIPLTIELFEEFPEVLRKYQNRFRYIMIDEYQDTNGAQARLADLLSMKSKNLCVVGDDDQAIYGWRGAEVKNILRFRNEKLIKLEENFRCTAPILSAANAVISHNSQRHGKTLWTNQKSNRNIELFHASSAEEEAKGVVFRILKFHEEGVPLEEMAILYRSNALSRHFERALIRTNWQKNGKWVRGIPFEVFGGVAFSETKEAKDVIAYIKLLDNPDETEALLRIMNVPDRLIHSGTIDLLTKAHRKEKQSLWKVLSHIDSFPEISAREKKAIRSLQEKIEDARCRMNKSIYSAAHYLLSQVGYQRAIMDEASTEKAAMFRLDNVEEVLSNLKQYEEQSKIAGKKAHLSEFLSSANMTLQPVKKMGFGVKLMTFHSAKGLEFDSCFLTCLEDHILPHEKCFHLEEERRLFYVAITRAKKQLCLSMSRKRKRHGKIKATTPSRFLHEIPKELFSFRSWDCPL